MRRNNGTMTSALIIITLVFTSAVYANLLQIAQNSGGFQGYHYLNKPDKVPGKLAYQIEEGADDENLKDGKILSYISSFLSRSKIIEKLLYYFDRSKSDSQTASYTFLPTAPNKHDTPLILQNDDEKTKFVASLSRDAPPKVITTGPSKEIKNEEWVNTLFGPTGVLTTIFHIIDDRRKDSIPKQHKANEALKLSSGNEAQSPEHHIFDRNNTHPQSDTLPFAEFFNQAKPVDFAKIFESFLSGSQGDFEDPLADLPEFLGICNRFSCGDIYKAIDQFRKSEFFTNFQTALQLIQDPKGWEILGDLLSNPELISQFTGGSGIEKVFGSSLTQIKQNSKKPKGEVVPEDGNLGTDFSALVNGRKPVKEKKPTESELPEIAENVDGVDYYSAVENGEDEDGANEVVATVRKPEETVKIPLGEGEVDKPDVDISLPEISGSIDENTESVTKTDSAATKRLSKTYKNVTMKSTRSTRPTSTTTISPYQPVTPLRQSVKNFNFSKIKSTTRKPITTLPTTRNFRRDNDYYAMYYDD